MASETISMRVVVWWYSRRLEKMSVHFVCHKPLSLGVRIFHLLSDTVFFFASIVICYIFRFDQDKIWDGLGTLFLHFIVVSPSDTFYFAEAFEFSYINIWYFNRQTVLLNRHNFFFLRYRTSFRNDAQIFFVHRSIFHYYR